MYDLKSKAKIYRIIEYIRVNNLELNYDTHDLEEKELSDILHDSRFGQFPQQTRCVLGGQSLLAICIPY